MNKSQIYKPDDAFKRKARAHQFAFRDDVLNVCCDERNPQVVLSAEAAKQGLMFFDGYRDLISKRAGGFKGTALFANMLRSEHIPYNIFMPMETDQCASIKLFSNIIGIDIDQILDIKIEFAGNRSREEYLNDGTSFDAYISYIATDGNIGGIGVEVKYTEQGYRLGSKEKSDILDPNGRYFNITKASGYFYSGFNIECFIRDNDLRQIWRNHILGYAMINKNDIMYFHHIHLYPEGNVHFRDKALPAYRRLLTDKGSSSFIELTYEKLLGDMSLYFVSDLQKCWIDYLRNRYLVKE